MQYEKTLKIAQYYQILYEIKSAKVLTRYKIFLKDNFNNESPSGEYRVLLEDMTIPKNANLNTKIKQIKSLELVKWI